MGRGWVVDVRPAVWRAARGPVNPRDPSDLTTRTGFRHPADALGRAMPTSGRVAPVARAGTGREPNGMPIIGHEPDVAEGPGRGVTPRLYATRCADSSQTG